MRGAFSFASGKNPNEALTKQSLGAIVVNGVSKLVTAASVLVAGFVGAEAAAQGAPENMFDRSSNVSVMERSTFDYSGVRRGAFIFSPELNLGLEYTDNLFGTSANEESDVAAVFNPTLNVESLWSRHALTADASLTRREYFDRSDESVWNGTVGAAGRLDIQRDAFLEGGLRYAALTEPRTSAGAAFAAAKPIEYDTFSAFVGGRRAANRLLFQGQFGLDQVDYDDAISFGGTPIDQDFRDHTQTTGMVRADFALSPDTAIFGRVRANQRDYDLAPPAVAELRDSEGLTIDAGADFDISNLARGLVGIGYTEQNYDSVALQDVDGLSVDGRVEWFPTQLTTVTFTASRAVKDAPFANSGGFFGTSVGVNIDHELRRNVIFSAGITVSEDDYQDIDRADERYSINAGVTYYMNRNVGVRGSWSYTDQDSSGAAANQTFERNVVGISLVLRP